MCLPYVNAARDAGSYPLPMSVRPQQPRERIRAATEALASAHAARTELDRRLLHAADLLALPVYPGLGTTRPAKDAAVRNRTKRAQVTQAVLIPDS
jgi:hypothetical protein